MLLKKYAEDHNRKGKEYTFKDFVLEGARTGTGTGLRQIGADNGNLRDKSVIQHNSTVTIATLHSAGDRTEDLQVGHKIHTMV